MTTTLDAVRHFATQSGDRPALRTARSAWSYRELRAAAEKAARQLERRGVRVAALAADNSPEWLVVDLAAQLAGVTLVPLPGFFAAQQIEHLLRDSGADALIAATPVPFARPVDDASQPEEPLLGSLRVWRRQPGTRPALPLGTAKISYTSGTTGQPKGVCLTQRSLDTVAASLCAAVAELAVTRHLCVLPLATLLENVAGVYAPLQAGAEIAVPGMLETGLAGASGFDVASLLRCLERYRPQSIILLPQLLAALVVALERGARRPAELRFIAVGGARVAPALLERADRLGLPVYEGYGLTECGSVVALNAPRARRVGSVGRPLPHVRIEIDAHAEIHAHSETVCGYVGSSGGAHRLATGDLGYLDADGFLHVNGRRKNVFITSFGRNVSPEWIETELTDEPAIAQVAAFGEARPWNVAVVVPRAGAAAADIQAAIERANSRLPDYARIGDWLYADEPFTATNGLATANGRNRRAAIWQRYGERVDSLYERQVSHMAH